MTGDTFDRFTPPERGRFGDNEQARPARSKRIDEIKLDIHLVLRMEKPRAIAVTPIGMDALAWIWLPRSKVQIARLRGSRTITVTMPEWLAKQKGLA